MKEFAVEYGDEHKAAWASAAKVKKQHNHNNNNNNHVPTKKREAYVPTGGVQRKKQEPLFGDSFEDGFEVPRRLHDKSDDFICTVNDWHFAMLNDFPRNEHYKNALKKVIVPGESICLEIGAGMYPFDVSTHLHPPLPLQAAGSSHALPPR